MMKKHKILSVIMALIILTLIGCGELTETKPADGTAESFQQTQDQTQGKPTEGTSEETPEKITTEAPTEAPSASEGSGEDKYEEVNDTVYTTDRLNVRKEESTEAEILGVLDKGEAVNRTGIHETWTRIIYQGQVAFVATAYITEAKPTEPETKEPIITSDGTGIFYDNGGYLVAIDPGHQGRGNSDKEPVGPGATEMKAKVSSGTQGVVTGIPEHEMNLVVSLYLRDELLSRGYSVLMIRETADVDISNAERAKLANDYHADLFVRIHGNSVSNPDVKGALTMCMTGQNPYNGNLHLPSRVLSEKVLEGLCAATGAVNKGIQETDTMSGINWCTVPVTIVEMGFMSNPHEDRAMAEDSYRRALAKGIADGIDEYCGRHRADNAGQ